MKRFGLIFAVFAFFLWPAAKPAQAQNTQGAILFEEHCAKCHGNPQSAASTPAVLSLWKLNPEQVMAGLAKAPHTSLAAVSNDDLRIVALYLGGRRVGVDAIAEAKAMPNHCSANPAITDITSQPLWNGWGNGESNARFQTAKAAGITPDQVAHLKLKWAFGFPGADEVYGQPTVAAGRVFVATDTGAVYSLNADTGCIYWSFQADGGVRNAISIGPVKGHGATKFGVYFGDVRSNAYMLDASTGKQIWKTKVEDHPVSRITGAPNLYDGRLYVPVSSGEERTAGYSNVYPCCTFRGSVVALDANTGKQIWKTYTVPQAPKLIGKTASGVEQWSPNGGAVWNTPTIDAKNQAIYIGTGDSYNPPAGKTTDAVMALDLKTGKIMWAVQDTENDYWLSGCPGTASPNCPKDMGPDYDFGASPILRTLPNGHRMLVAGQKSGMVWGHDPDREGTLVWNTPLVQKLALGVIRFGGAADDQNAYFGISNGGLAALDIATGAKKWFTPIPGPSTPGPRGETSAVTVIPGVVFSGSYEGMLRAFATDDGHLLWEYNMIHDYQTVNDVPGKGGSMGQPGPTVAGGMLFAGSGYIFATGIPGNTLLAFSPQ